MPGLNPTEQDYQQFTEITGADRSTAAHFLENGTTVQGAIEDFFASGEIDQEDSDEANLDDALMAEDQPAAPAGGPRTLGGQAVDTSLPEGWGQQEKKKTGRVGDWNSGDVGRKPGQPATLANTGHRPQEDDSDDEEEAKKKGNKELYTGGEKSGLAVQNPDRGKGQGRGIVDEILKQARSEQQPEAPSGSGFFGGSGNALGSEDTPAAPAAPTPAPAPARGGLGGLLSGLMGGGAPPPEEEDEEVQTRHLIFWRNGFSIEDGPLMLYDTPGNPEILRAIQNGRAPPSLFGVGYNQPLQVEVQQRTGEDYVQQAKPKPKGGFSGGGNRLGSVTPDVAPAAPAPAPPVSQGGSTGNAPKFEVDSTQPTTSVQLRLADGSKLVAKVNLTHTVQDLRNFITAANADSNMRNFVLQTTFPNKELTDGKLTIEQAGLKNAVVVQRFT